MIDRFVLLIITVLFGIFVGFGYFNINDNNELVTYSDIGGSDNVSISSDLNDISYSIDLNTIGESYYIDFYITNSNDFDMYIDNIDILESDYIDYSVVYSDGSFVNVGDIIKQNSKVYVKIIGTYVKSSDTEISIPNQFSITCSQA